MSRNKLPPGEQRITTMMKLPPEDDKRLKVICSRRSVIALSKFSVTDFIAEKVSGRLPPRPTKAQIAAYMAKYPKATLELDP